MGNIERVLGVNILPEMDREQVLDAVDSALARIELIMKTVDERSHGGDGRERERHAFHRFMDALKGPLTRYGARIEVRENRNFVKLESKINGHRVYINKGKVKVGRVDTTLPTNLIPGAVRPTHINGRIMSWIPATVQSVTLAIELLGMTEIPQLN